MVKVITGALQSGPSLASGFLDKKLGEDSKWEYLCVILVCLEATHEDLGFGGPCVDTCYIVELEDCLT